MKSWCVILLFVRRVTATSSLVSRRGHKSAPWQQLVDNNHDHPHVRTIGQLWVSWNDDSLVGAAYLGEGGEGDVDEDEVPCASLVNARAFGIRVLR